MLTDDQHAAYVRDGFAIVDGFFNADEVAVMRAELARLQAAGLLRNVCTDGDGETESMTQMNLQICPLSPQSEVARALVFAPKVVAMAEQLLGGVVSQRLDQIFLKPARHGAGTNWHQDNGYFSESRGQDADRGFGMWIALHDASPANGTLQLIPGRYREVFDHRRDGGSDHHVTCADTVDPSQAVAVSVAAGGVAVFNYGVPHATGPNTTDHERAGLALHFLDQRIAAATTNPIRGPILNGPECDGGQAKWGDDQRGRWAALVADQVASSF